MHPWWNFINLKTDLNFLNSMEINKSIPFVSEFKPFNRTTEFRSTSQYNTNVNTNYIFNSLIIFILQKRPGKHTWTHFRNPKNHVTLLYETPPSMSFSWCGGHLCDWDGVVGEPTAESPLWLRVGTIGPGTDRKVGNVCWGSRSFGLARMEINN